MRGAGVAALFACSGALAQGLWEKRAQYPIQATEVSAAALNGKVYAVCGLTPQGSTNRLFVYDPFNDTWTAGAPAPIPGGADHCNFAAAGGKLYILGAIGNGNTYEYDPAADSWSIVARMATPRGASGAAAIGTKIYVAGGLADRGSVATFEMFDTAARQWSSLPDMPTPRDHLTAQAIGGKFYAVGGRAGPNLQANEEYDPGTNSWRSRAPLPTARGGIGSGTIGDRIQVFGGEGPSGRPEGTYPQNEEYDPATDTWRSLAPMPTPRHGLYGATLDGRVFTPSGGPVAGANYSDANEVFFLAPAQAPHIAAAVNAASYDRALAPGTIVALFGERLSQGEQQATQLPFPSRMNAVSVMVNGAAAPLWYVGPGQINFQLPYSLPTGGASVQVSNAGAASSAVTVDIAEAAPGIFAVFPPAVRRGEFIQIYGTGLGAVSDAPAPGQAAPATPPARTVATPTVTIGGEAAEVQFSGLAPGSAGIYQINARVPGNLPAGASVPVAVRAGGRTSNSVTVSVVPQAEASSTTRRRPTSCGDRERSRVSFRRCGRCIRAEGTVLATRRITRAYLPSTTSIPARINSSLARGSLPTRSVRSSLSNVTVWEAFATDSRGRPVRRGASETLPGAFAHRRLLVRGTQTTVAILL